MSDAETPPLRPANENPWYCLATLHGEQQLNDRSDWDRELAEKNRLAWNRWAGDMTEEERAEHARAFVRRTGKPGMPPQPTEDPDFSDTLFNRPAIFQGFSFVKWARFNSSTFSQIAYFHKAAFSENASFALTTFATASFFHDATFSSPVNFEGATFSAPAIFFRASFHTVADFSSTAFFRALFEEAKFFDRAIFSSARFSENSDFNSATFSKRCDFSSCSFAAASLFVNTKFVANTSFADARFESKVPDFRGATLHEATEWHGVTWPQPPNTKTDAQDQVYAYERLKQEMERLKKHADEQDFFRRELRARRGLARVWSSARALNLLYQILSDYGNSISRPLLWLFGVFVIGASIFAHAPLYCGAPMPIKLAAKLSFANIFVFLPDRREIMMTGNMVECLSNTTQAVSAAQSLLGVILLFLVGLAIRSRFRMK